MTPQQYALMQQQQYAMMHQQQQMQQQQQQQQMMQQYNGGETLVLQEWLCDIFSPPIGAMPPPQQPQEVFGSKSADVRGGSLSNNYSRPGGCFFSPALHLSIHFDRRANLRNSGGQQNVGNFLTDRPSSRVLAPPGGKSQISFG